MTNAFTKTFLKFSPLNIMRNFKGVYEKLKILDVPEIPPWRKNSKDSTFPCTSEMLEDIVSNFNNDKQNTLQYRENLDKLKKEFVLNTNRGEGEGTQTMESTEVALIKSDVKNISSEEQVSKNLFDAINHLEKRNLEKNKDDNKALLDVEECIQDTHTIVMKNLLSSNKCGHFSTERRFAADDGHEYPIFETEEDANKAVQGIVDKYNDTVDYIKTNVVDPVEQTLMYFRCAAWLLYNFVDLHPFSDGNGRMCRLLASHCLYLVFPFPCPTYNIYAPTIRDDYLNAVKKARRAGGNDFGDLVALIIDSGWHTDKKVCGYD